MARRLGSRRVAPGGALCALLAAACVPSLQGNASREPDRQLPARYRGEPAPEAAAPAGAVAAQRTFAEFFASPQIHDLIDAAIAHNQELNVRLQEIIIAQNEATGRQGEYLPRVDASVGAGIERTGRYTSRGASDDALGLSQALGDFGFGLVGTWEVDIWSKLRDAKKAADLRAFEQIEARNFLVTQIVAEVARSYYELVAIDHQIEILHRNIEIQEDALAAVKNEMLAARVTGLAVQRFEAEVLKNKGRIFELEQERVRTENRVNFVVGRYPQEVDRDPAQFDGPLPDVVRAGLPSELLDNRPDVRQAELALGAAKLDVGVARASFYPALRLDAGVGYRAFNLAHLVTTPASLVANLAGGLVAPLLNRQAITAQYRSANARQLQAVFSYERTLLQAFTDVANQLALVGNLQRAYDLQARQVQTLKQAVSFSTDLFASARADYMEVLLTRRDSLEAEMQLVETKKRQFAAVIGVYQALGGGWQRPK